MDKILIIGAPGTGKTTMANKIGMQRKTPVFSLDEVKWIGHNTHKPIRRNDTEINELINNILNKEKDWIFEGCNLSEFVYPIIKQSNHIIILKTKRSIRLWKIIKRFIKSKFYLEQSNNKKTFRGLFRALKLSYVYDKEILPQIINTIKKYSKDKVTKFETC